MYEDMLLPGTNVYLYRIRLTLLVPHTSDPCPPAVLTTLTCPVTNTHVGYGCLSHPLTASLRTHVAHVRHQQY